MLQSGKMYHSTPITSIYGSPWFLSPYPNKLSRLPLEFDELPGELMRDPRSWTREDVAKWLNWCEREFTLSGINTDRFFMNGKALCMLKKEDFVERAPNAGDVLFNYLQQILSSSAQVYSSLNYKPLSPSLYRNGSLSLSEHYGSQPQQSSISSPMPTLYSMTSQSPERKCLDSSVFLSPAPSSDSRDSPLQDSNHSEGLMQTTCHQIRVSSHSPGLEIHEKEDELREHSDSTLSPQQHYRQPFTSCRLLWDFIYQLLTDPNCHYDDLIKWKDENNRIFRILNPNGLARLWGIQKNHTNMNFDKMSRALRYYYRVGILKKESGERHCYRFLCSVKDLRQNKQRTLPSKHFLARIENSVKDEPDIDLSYSCQ